ncbi:MAG: EAL domain-containing protein [Burkholderiales bacterium]|nr:EAL domain-containing protein [Burkholderiales bacterium]
MKSNARNRFIVRAIACYTVVALAWIFLSDRLLLSVVDIDSILWLSNAKGAFFVVASSAVFYLIFRALPLEGAASKRPLLDALAASLMPGSLPRWLVYVFAATITLSVLLVQQRLGLREQPLLIFLMFPIIFSAMLGGFGPGMVSTVLAVLGAMLLAIQPAYSLRIVAGLDWVRWAFLVVDGVVVSLLSEVLQRALSRAELNRRLLDSVISGTPDVVYVKDVDGRYLLVNQAAINASGKTADEILGHNDIALFPAETAQRLMAKDREVLAAGTAQTYEQELTTVDGRCLVLQVSKGPIFDKAGQVAGLFGIAREISERKLAEQKLRQAATVFESTRDGVMITDLETRVLAVNKAFTEITGYTEAEALGNTAALQRSGRHGPEFFQALWTSLRGTGQWQGEIWNRRKNGEVYPVWMSIAAVNDENARPMHYVSVFSDISQLKRSEEELRHLAHYDPLTGLPNRLLIQSRLEHALSRAERDRRLVAVLFIDLDHFKTVNDSLGHVVGDQLLVDVARRLCGRVRDEDSLGRFGGDEFLLLLEPIDTPEEAALVARDILKTLTPAFCLSGCNEIFIGASIGISIYPDDGRNAADLLRDADAAMYEAKELGRNRFCFYTTDMNMNAMLQLELEAALRRALERNEFILHYQPKVDLCSGAVSGAEALIRWQRNGKGLESPGRFIPLAEKIGLIVPIGAWVIDAGCRQLRAWQDAGWPDLCLSVNVSGRQFYSGDLALTVEQALARHGVQPASLELEVTESMLMESPENTIAILRVLKEIGVKVALDDFGTGYSSFSYLSRFPIDTLKIDQSFVRNIVSEPDAAMIAVSIIDLAHRMHLKVVAEGVETEAQLAYLRTRHCDEMQGYYFARPMPAADFHAMLKEEKCLPQAPEREMQLERTLLLVDDELHVLSALERLLSRDGYRLLTADSGARALEILAAEPVQVILSDQRMPEMSGTDFLSRAKEMYPDTVRILLTGYADIESVTRAVNDGAVYKFLYKPWNNELLREHMRNAFLYHAAVIKARVATDA